MKTHSSPLLNTEINSRYKFITVDNLMSKMTIILVTVSL